MSAKTWFTQSIGSTWRLPKAALGLCAVGLSLLITTQASAGEFFYPDRSGRVHIVPVTVVNVAQASSNSTSSEDSRIDTNRQVLESNEVEPLKKLPKSATKGNRTASVTNVPTLETDPSAIPYFTLIREAADMYALPPELVLAVTKVESNFNPKAVSKKGAMGLMQLMPATASAMGVVDAYDPRQNVMAGARLLRILVNDFDGDVSLAVAAYNAGAGSVRRHGGVPPISETQNYVPTVMQVYRGYAASGVARGLTL